MAKRYYKFITNTKQLIMKIYLLKNGTEVLRAFQDYDTAVLKKAISNENLTIETVDFSESLLEVESDIYEVRLLDDDEDTILDVKLEKTTTIGDELEYLDVIHIRINDKDINSVGFSPDMVRRITVETEQFADNKFDDINNY